MAAPPNASRVYADTSTGVYVFEDQDDDALPDAWERTYGLDTRSVTGADGPNGDPDADGATNQQEFHANTHPRGFYTRFFAEGAIKDRLDLEHYKATRFFDTRFALLNPGDEPASVLMRFLRSDGSVVPWSLDMTGQSRATVDARLVPGLAGVLLAGVGLGVEDAEFATVVESDRPVVVDRTMTWDESGYGSHAETSLAGPATDVVFRRRRHPFGVQPLLPGPEPAGPARRA